MEERRAVEEVVRRYTGPGRGAQVRFRDAERGRVALITVFLPPDQPLPSAHRRAGRSSAPSASGAGRSPT